MALIATAVTVMLAWRSIESGPALWRDEVNAVNTAAAASWSEVWARAQFESFPLLWLALLRGWIAVAGESDGAIRVFGFLGALTLPAAVWFAARRWGRVAPALSLALIAVNPEIVRWSASVRAWGFGAALAIVGLATLTEASLAPARGRIVLAALFAVLSVQCVFQNAIFVAAAAAACALIALRPFDARRWIVPLGVSAIAALALSPYAGLFARRAEWSALGAGPLSIEHIAARVSDLIATSGPLVAVAWVALVAAALSLGAGALVRGSGDARFARITASLVTLLASVFCLTVLYLTMGYPTQAWYYVGLAAIVAVTAERIVVAAWPEASVRRWIAVAGAVVLATGIGSAWTGVLEPYTNIDRVAARLETAAQRGDLIVVNPWFLDISLARYYHGAAEVTTIPPMADHAVMRYDLLKRQMESDAVTAPIVAAIHDALANGHRVWVVGSLNAPPPGRPPALPHPPLPETAWNSLPYEVRWSEEVAGYIRDHATHEEALGVDAIGGRFEDVRVLFYSGWRQ